jgi:hypothetical protein
MAENIPGPKGFPPPGPPGPPGGPEGPGEPGLTSDSGSIGVMAENSREAQQEKQTPISRLSPDHQQKSVEPESEANREVGEDQMGKEY